jgi:hypothetical protein
MKSKHTVVKIHLKNLTTAELNLQPITIENEGFYANLLQNRIDKNFLLEKNHNSITSTINLSQLAPYVILQFNENKKFTGATFSLNETHSPFSIKALAEYFLLVPYPLKFNLNEIARFDYKKIN